MKISKRFNDILDVVFLSVVYIISLIAFIRQGFLIGLTYLVLGLNIYALTYLIRYGLKRVTDLICYIMILDGILLVLLGITYALSYPP